MMYKEKTIAKDLTIGGLFTIPDLEPKEEKDQKEERRRKKSKESNKKKKV